MRVVKINSAIYGGRLTKDAEFKTISKGDKSWEVAYFTIAAQDDSNYKKVDFINCQADAKDIKYLRLYGKKGVYMEFRGKTSSYLKDGKTQQIAKAYKLNIIFANSKKESKEEETDEPPVF